MRTSVFVLFAAAACSTPRSNTGPDASATDSGAGDSTSDVDGGVDAPTPPMITVLRGVDRASVFSLAEAQVLKNNHAVKWTGVYIGGPCNGGSGWTKALVSQFASQLDWTFMPTYVGQQSAAICGAHTLTAAQGTADAAATVSRMMTFGWQPNRDIPVALDLEAGTYAANASGSTAYAKAWRDAVRAAGYKAYIYSNPTGINGMFDAGVKFDGAWAASYFYTSFAAVKPEDLTQLGGRYTNQNRAWQYGNFNVSGAGNVDGDTSHLLLAPAPDGTNL
jgi:hypothetical protein